MTEKNENFPQRTPFKIQELFLHMALEQYAFCIF